MFTKRRVIALLCVLVLLGGCAWVYELCYAPYEAEAELMVLPRSDLDSLFDGRGSDAVGDDQAVIAQNMVHMIRSRPVIAAALSNKSIMDHPLVQEHAADPEGFVMGSLAVEVKQPGLIVVRMTDRHDPAICADIVNAIVDAFVSRTAAADRSQKLETVTRLEKNLSAQTELEKKKRSDLEVLRNSMSDADRDPWARIELTKVQVEQLKLAAGRSHEKVLEMRLLDAEVGDNWDQENRLAKSKRFEEEYDRNMTQLKEVLGLLAVRQRALQDGSSGSFEMDMRQREIDLLREQVDELVRMRRRAELALESGSRVEVISPAVKPVSRRHWFGGRDDAG